MIRKVPEISIYFWIIKILTTAMGESTSDYLISHFDPYIAVGVCGLGFVITLIGQILCKRYIPWVYWLAVVMVAVFGTMAADVTHVVLGVPYILSATFFAIALMIIFIGWYKSEKTLSIHSITTTKRELWYWATVLATFALGTALGDLTASSFNLGYLASGILFAFLFAVPFTLSSFWKINAIFTFWFAYIITRPLGASFADWFSKPILGGLGLGDGSVSLVLSVIIIIFVSYISITKKDTHLQN